MEFSRAINENGLLYVPYEEVKQQEEKLKQELETHQNALEFACWLLSRSSECFSGYCPLDKTIIKKECGIESKHCPDCSNHYVWQEYFLQKAREE